MWGSHKVSVRGNTPATAVLPWLTPQGEIDLTDSHKSLFYWSFLVVVAVTSEPCSESLISLQYGNLQGNS